MCERPPRHHGGGLAVSPNLDVCPHGNLFAADGGEARLLGGEYVLCKVGDQPDLFHVGDEGPAGPWA